MKPGGRSVVYKAFDTKLERTVALKVLRPQAIGDPNAEERFIREARVASALNHSNITTIHEIDECHGKGFASILERQIDELNKEISRCVAYLTVRLKQTG